MVVFKNWDILLLLFFMIGTFCYSYFSGLGHLATVVFQDRHQLQTLVSKVFNDGLEGLVLKDAGVRGITIQSGSHVIMWCLSVIGQSLMQ